MDTNNEATEKRATLKVSFCIDVAEKDKAEVIDNINNNPANIIQFNNIGPVGVFSVKVEEDKKEDPEPIQPVPNEQLPENDPNIVDGEAKEVEE